jgi:hypothetical protein
VRHHGGKIAEENRAADAGSCRPRVYGVRRAVREGFAVFAQDGALVAAVPGVPVASPGDHVAHFYHDDGELAGQAGSYLLDAFRDDGVAIAIATPEHLRALEAWLAGAGVDVAAARARGSWLVLDAAATLRQFSSGGTPGAAGFDREVGGLIRQAAGGGRAVRAFGEIVALLWPPAWWPLPSSWRRGGTT